MRMLLQQEISQNFIWVADKSLEIHLSIWKHLWGTLPREGRKKPKELSYIKHTNRLGVLLLGHEVCQHLLLLFPTVSPGSKSLSTLSQPPHKAPTQETFLWRRHQTFSVPLRRTPVQDQRWSSKEIWATSFFRGDWKPLNVFPSGGKGQQGDGHIQFYSL